MIYEFINRPVEVNVSFSRPYGEGGSAPRIYQGILLDVDEKHLKLKYIQKRKEDRIMIINLNHVIYVREVK